MIRLLVIVLVWVSTIQCWAEQTIYLTDGKFQKGTIVTQNPKGVTFEFLKSGKKARVNIPWTAIDKIEFAESKQLQNALKNPDQVELSVLVELWDQQVDYLSRPVSKTAQIGLVYADKLAVSEEELCDEAAIDLYDEIAEKAWSAAYQGQAIRSKLRLLIKSGREREAIRQAEALAEKTENPEHLLEAKYVLAESAFAELKEIEAENPRWDLDDEVKPERNQVFNRAVDLSLYAFLFYGTQEVAAARGLLHAAEVYEFSKDYKNAEICVGDILRLYPNSALASDAKKQLDKLSKIKKK